MRTQKIAFVLLLLVSSEIVLGQCNDISIRIHSIDSALLTETEEIKTSAYFIVNYGSSLLKDEGWGLIVEEKNSTLIAQKISLKGNGTIKKVRLTNNKIQSHIKEFFADSIYKQNREVQYDSSIVVFDPYILKMHYHDAFSDWCLYFKQGLAGLKVEGENEALIVWLRRLIRLL